MLAEILVASALIAATVVLEAGFIGAAVLVLQRAANWLARERQVPRLVLSLTLLTLWLLAGISVSFWLWALAFYGLGEFETIESALYFAIVAGTTLGFGDQILSEEWQLLSGFIAANGLVLFSLNTAFLIEAIRRLDTSQVVVGKNNQENPPDPG